MMTLSEMARITDLSAVGGGVAEDLITELAELGLRHRFIGVHAMPAYLPLLLELLGENEDILPGTGIGFPSGAHPTAVKVLEGRLALGYGARELDMVVNIGALRSGRDQYVVDEIKAMKELTGDLTLKVILEVHHLTNDQIKKGCELCIRGGADFVKTATGWFPTGATPENITLLKSVAGNDIKVKAAGAIRDIATAEELVRCGASRLGIGVSSMKKIIEEFRSRGQTD